MAVNAAVAAIGMRVDTYIQPGGTGTWYDHNGYPAIPVAGPNGACTFEWVTMPPPKPSPDWKITNHCTGGRSCTPPLSIPGTMPLGTIVQTNCH